ncbi:MAG: hypothetical protein AAB573_01705 [Patescibacteria group bacterium]
MAEKRSIVLVGPVPIQLHSPKAHGLIASPRRFIPGMLVRAPVDGIVRTAEVVSPCSVKLVDQKQRREHICVIYQRFQGPHAGSPKVSIVAPRKVELIYNQ